MGLNILLVDDSKTIRDVIAKTLELAEVPIENLFKAANGREALDILEANWIDIVFADINMPVMNGVEMIEKMSEDGLLRTIPVIIVSTEGSAPRIEMLKSKGVRAYIRKPFTPELIRKVVRDILGVEGEKSREDTVRRVVAEVLEKHAFLFLEPDGDGAQADAAGDLVMASMTFSGPLGGSIRMAAPMEMAALVAINVLGLDDQDPPGQERALDAFRELLNVLCGHVITALAGEQAVVEMEPPSCEAVDGAAWQVFSEEPGVLRVVAEGMPVLVNLQVQESAR